MNKSSQSSVPRVSARAVNFFSTYSRRYLRRRFHSIRILKNGLPPLDCTQPLVIYLNHAAWWDPLVCLLLAREYFASRTSFAPIDSAMLARYGIFKHLGFFGVEQRTARGAREFLRTSRAILTSPHSALWLTPQGRFMDVRERPLHLQNGIGALAAGSENEVFLPLAIEYAFWTEPRPEILVSFGAAIVTRDAPRRDAAEWTHLFAHALESAQDDVAAHSCRREPHDWRMLDRGNSGVNGIYDAWRSLRAWMTGKKFSPEHHAE